MKYKICKKCNIELLISNFTKSKNIKDGFENMCKNCRNEARKKYINNCLICDKSFRSSNRNTKFCGFECQGKSKQKRVLTKCIFCEKELEIIVSKYNKGENFYCNQICRSEHLKILMCGENNLNYNKIKHYCSGCRKEIYVIPSRIKNQKYIFCENACYKKHIGSLVSESIFIDDAHKTCSSCGEIKKINEFYKSRASYEKRCKVCRNKENKERYSLICEICNSNFKAERKQTKYCSKKCLGISLRKRKTVKCDFCEKDIERPLSQFNGKYSKYCSKICKDRDWSKLYSGENSVAYNHDKPLEERLLERKYVEYYVWRNSVYKRDNYMCQCCQDNRGGNLVAHHILNYSEHIDLRTDINNGITLCKVCHKKFHDNYGYKNNNFEQLKVFLKEYIK